MTAPSAGRRHKTDEEQANGFAQCQRSCSLAKRINQHDRRDFLKTISRENGWQKPANDKTRLAKVTGPKERDNLSLLRRPRGTSDHFI